MILDDFGIKTDRVAIVGVGLVSPLGIGLTDNLASLRSARDCVTSVNAFPTEACRCRTAGQVEQDLIPASKRENRLHRASQMMIRALEEVVSQDPYFIPDFAVIGTTSGGMSFGEQYYRCLHAHGSLRRAPHWIASYPPQKPVMDALESAGFQCGCQIIANACASGTNAIGHAFACIRSGRYQRVLTGGYDALSELVFVGFDSLQASTPEKCRPFDRHRTGMVLGEGAAVLALENPESAEARNAPILGYVTGYGISTDNHHLTQPDPTGIGPRRAMEKALQSARIESGAVDYINAHGTATPFNDSAEGRAIMDLFGDSIPVSSTKSMMGHSLGAAGAIEAVFCLLALQHQFLPANINFEDGDPDLHLNIVANRTRPAHLNRALSNSFGFGGTNASVVIERSDE